MYQGYRNLIVWQKAMDLVQEVYGLVKLLPKEETHALPDQMRRAVVSIPSNPPILLRETAEAQTEKNGNFCLSLKVPNTSWKHSL